jgi:hypothetical protein
MHNPVNYLLLSCLVIIDGLYLTLVYLFTAQLWDMVDHGFVGGFLVFGGALCFFITSLLVLMMQTNTTETELRRRLAERTVEVSKYYQAKIDLLQATRQAELREYATSLDETRRLCDNLFDGIENRYRKQSRTTNLVKASILGAVVTASAVFVIWLIRNTQRLRNSN